MSQLNHRHQENLITGLMHIITDEEAATIDFMTAWFKGLYGDCNSICEWDREWGFVPEAGCPVHD